MSARNDVKNIVCGDTTSSIGADFGGEERRYRVRFHCRMVGRVGKGCCFRLSSSQAGETGRL